MSDVKWEFSKNGLDIKSAKGHLHLGSDEVIELHIRNLTAEERELVEQYLDILENMMGIDVTIEEAKSNG